MMFNLQKIIRPTNQVIAALTPSITEAVKAALAGQSQTTVTITQQAQVIIWSFALHADADANNFDADYFQPGRG